MIWGEVINAVRSLHLKMLDEYNWTPTFIGNEVKFSESKFHFPKSKGNFSDWHEKSIPDALEMHAVERVLLEGPLLPVEQIAIQNESEATIIFKQILFLEREWLQKQNIHNSDTVSFLEKNWTNEWLPLQRQV